MTYGENAGTIRNELVGLLRHHRVQQRIGGRGSYSVPESTTLEQREQLGRVIRRYRHAVLVWGYQALHATGDKTRPARARPPTGLPKSNWHNSWVRSSQQVPVSCD